MSEKLELKTLKLSKDLQVRQNGINSDTITEYAFAMKKGGKFPSITVFKVDGKNYVVDGFHRTKAAEEAGLKTINCDVQVGTWKEALHHATFIANRKNGMRLSRADLQAIVEKLVLDDEYSDYPSEKLADLAGVSHTTIQRARNRLGRRPEKVLASDGTYRSQRSNDPVDYNYGPPPQGIGLPEDRFQVLSEKVIDRLQDHVSDVKTSINKLEDDELLQWASSSKRDELLEDIQMLQQMLEQA